MRSTTRTAMKWLVCTGAATALAGCSWMPWSEKEDPTVVPFKTIMGGAYQGFLKNWDDSRQPVFCALIRNREDWEKWMQAAPVAGDQRPMGPSNAHFDTKQYLVVARVMQAPDAAEQAHVFTPLSVSARDGVLRLNYLYRAPLSNASYRVKDYLMLAIPRERPATSSVAFYENDKKVCQLAN